MAPDHVKLHPKAVLEYPLPAAAQTHEITAVPGTGLLLVTQQTDSTLVKVAVDQTGVPLRAVGHVLGTQRSGLHGLYASTSQPGLVWATLQFESTVVLVDPVSQDLNEPPRVLACYRLPAPARGPHVVVEDGGVLWVTAKDSGHVVRIIISESSQDVYPAGRRPIFVARHANSGLVFATEDQSSKLLRIHPDRKRTDELDIPASRGSTPVGMVSGPDGNVWFVLLGGSSGGTGTFGRITGPDTIQYFQLASHALKTAGLIHLAWDTRPGQEPRLLLLASSMADPSALNAVVVVTFTPDFSAVATQATALMATPACMNHRVLATDKGWYVTELQGCQIAHISSQWTGAGSRAVNEASDYFSDFGMGARTNTVAYGHPFESCP
jgi:virginiamycin B lyase